MGQKINYKKKKQFNTKTILMIAGVIFLLLVLIMVRMKQQAGSHQNTTGYDQSAPIKTPDKFEDAKAIIEYFGSVYISEKESTTEGIEKDIYLRFKYDLYEENESQESWYTRLIRMLAVNQEYADLQLIDNSKDIVIQIICDTEIQGITKIIINGDENYFVNHDSKTALDNYGNEKITQFTVDSSVIARLMENNWYIRNINFGTKESTFDEYDIYFDEGIKVRSIEGYVFNLIFTEKYNGTVVNGISPQTSSEEVQQILGTPLFEDASIGMYGYKGSDFYVFFAMGEISIYKVQKSIDTTEFIKIIQEFNQGGTVKELGSNLTDLWPDYDYYSYDTGYVELSYALKGVKLQYNIDNTNGIVLFNNYIGEIAEGVNISDRKQSGIQALESLYFKNTDLVFETESKRAKAEYFKRNERDPIIEEETSFYRSKNFYLDFTKVDETGTSLGPKFISIHQDVPDSELDEHTAVNQYFWYDDNHFVYSTKNQGIYVYNCITRQKKTIVEGKDSFELQSLENGILTYDGKSIQIYVD